MSKEKSGKETETQIDEVVIPEEPEEMTPEDIEKAKDKKIKNMISTIILLSGLFAGSLFVDVVQMVRGGGFSQRALSKTDAFTSSGKTWVAFSDPIVKVSVINDDSCGEPCAPDEVLVGLKQAVPTMVSQKINVDSPEGQKLISEFGIKTIPTFIFSSEIEKTDLFVKAESFLEKGDGGYMLKGAQAGLPVGKYLVAPSIEGSDISLGASNAVLTIVNFGNFQSTADKKFFSGSN